MSTISPGAIAAALLAAAVSDRPPIRIPAGDSRPASVRRASDRDWPKYCADAEMTGEARHETRISVSSIPTIQLSWKATLSGSIASSPTVVAGRVYVGDWGGNEWALDAASGSILATANLGTTPEGNCAPPVLGISSAAAYDRGKIYLAGGDDAFYSLDPVTLETVWMTKLGDNSPSGGYYGWSSPSVFGGRVFQGISSHCDDPFIAGGVVEFDDASGTVVAAADLSRAADPSGFGAGVWTSPAIDRDARTIFVATASASAYEDGLAYSLVRLSLDDLAVQDSWKIPIEVYRAVPDADWGSSPTLFRDAGGRLLVGASQKDGQYYAFERSKLAAGPVWKTPLAAAGECPNCGDGSISTAAFDGRHLYVGGGRGVSGGAPFRGSVSALDPATGTPIWTFTGLHGPVLAPISVANGVVFATGGTFCIALDAATGALLWDFNAGVVLYGGVAISDGRIFFGDTAGRLYAFEVAGTSP